MEEKKASVMSDAASRTQIVLARSAVVLLIAFVIFGVAYYGFSAEVRWRVWRHLLDRPGGPMSFRIILQPTMAAIAALHDGMKDAKSERSPYLWTVLTNPAKRGERLSEALISTARVILLGLAIDTIYQFIMFKTFYPAEAAIVALILAFLPYLLLRGPVARITHWWRGNAPADAAQ
jgi:hypothetical protein